MTESSPTIYIPDGFFRAVHSDNVPGRIVVRRKIGSRTNLSRLTGFELAQIVGTAAGERDFGFTFSSFNGLPLLLNFSSTRTISLSFPFNSRVEKNTLDISDEFEQFILGKEILVPSALLYDGVRIHLLWILDTPIIGREVWQFYILQEGLASAFQEYPDLQLSYPQLGDFLPLVGTRQTEGGGKITRIDEHSWRGEVAKNRFQDLLLKKASAYRLETLRKAASILAELEELFHSRWMGMSSQTKQHVYWIKYLGAALGYFRSQEGVRDELIAVAESLTGFRWSKIKSDYSSLIDETAQRTRENFFRIHDTTHSLDHFDWIEGAENDFEISWEEISGLGLYQICESEHRMILPQKINPDQPPRLNSFGEGEWVPKERLLLKAAA